MSAKLTDRIKSFARIDVEVVEDGDWIEIRGVDAQGQMTTISIQPKAAEELFDKIDAAISESEQLLLTREQEARACPECGTYIDDEDPPGVYQCRSCGTRYKAGNHVYPPTPRSSKPSS